MDKHQSAIPARHHRRGIAVQLAPFCNFGVLGRPHQRLRRFHRQVMRRPAQAVLLGRHIAAHFGRLSRRHHAVGIPLGCQLQQSNAMSRHHLQHGVPHVRRARAAYGNPGHVLPKFRQQLQGHGARTVPRKCRLRLVDDCGMGDHHFGIPAALLLRRELANMERLLTNRHNRTRQQPIRRLHGRATGMHRSIENGQIKRLHRRTSTGMLHLHGRFL
mmetsp:Transcript_11066/g.31813  ORF Transcript_11066/g.31813 Transcript_11066/m.31813 type:complete len:216 (-) Transcript_11066:478-1125(-)